MCHREQHNCKTTQRHKCLPERLHPPPCFTLNLPPLIPKCSCFKRKGIVQAPLLMPPMSLLLCNWLSCSSRLEPLCSTLLLQLSLTRVRPRTPALPQSVSPPGGLSSLAQIPSPPPRVVIFLGSRGNECFHSYSGNPIIIQGSQSPWKPRRAHGVEPSLTHPRTLEISVKIQLP